METGKNCVLIFSENRISQASAALAYYLTMTVFPVLIVVYAILGNSYENFVGVLGFARRFLAEELFDFLLDFSGYVYRGDSAVLLPLGLVLLMSYGAAAIRSVHGTVGAMQGGAEHKGLRSYIFSVLYAVMLLALMYFALLIILLGEGALGIINAVLPESAFEMNSFVVPYFIIAALVFAFLLLLYHVPKRNFDSYSVLPGAVLGCFALIVISPIFSAFIARSVKYSLVYGSLASLILLMIWLYMCCLAIYSGAVLNIALYKSKAPPG